MGTSSWRELLRTIINDPPERNRIAAAAGVRSITLIRWINEDSHPRPENLRQLLRVLPAEYQRQFQELLEQEEGPILALPAEGTNQPEEIPFTLHIQGYTNLMTLAFEPKEFYSLSLINLRVIPPLHVQQTYIANFQQQVQHLLRESLRSGQTI